MERTKSDKDKNQKVVPKPQRKIREVVITPDEGFNETMKSLIALYGQK